MTLNLAEVRGWVQEVLMDSGAALFPTTLIDQGLRMCLRDYSRACPLQRAEQLRVQADGRELVLDNLPDLLEVTEAWWPYDEVARWPARQVRGFRVFYDNDLGRRVLYLNDLEGGEPQAGEYVRVWYTAWHTLDGLDGATTTTVPREHVELLVTGTAGQAALSRGLDLVEIPGSDLYQVGLLASWGKLRLREFHAGLERLRAASARSGRAWGPGGWRF